jgi:carbon storage regulator
MLVLSRKPGESILIGEDVEVTVLQGSGRGRIQLGIRAPREVPVIRRELQIRPRPRRRSNGGRPS